MRDTIEIGKSEFVSLMAAVLNPCSSLLPGEEPIPGWVRPDPESCGHWIDLTTIIVKADAAIGRMLDEADRGSADADVVATNGSALRALADDLCSAPPKVPGPWPPPRRRLSDDGLTGPQLMVLAARFQAAADSVADHALAPDLNAAADRMFGEGVSRLAS
jgi:hypothetical protein